MWIALDQEVATAETALANAVEDVARCWLKLNLHIRRQTQTALSISATFFDRLTATGYKQDTEKLEKKFKRAYDRGKRRKQ